MRTWPLCGQENLKDLVIPFLGTPCCNSGWKTATETVTEWHQSQTRGASTSTGTGTGGTTHILWKRVSHMQFTQDTDSKSHVSPTSLGSLAVHRPVNFVLSSPALPPELSVPCSGHRLGTCHMRSHLPSLYWIPVNMKISKITKTSLEVNAALLWLCIINWLSLLKHRGLLQWQPAWWAHRNKIKIKAKMRKRRDQENKNCMKGKT